MIHTLPREVIERIVHYLLLLRYEMKTVSRQAPVGYSSLRTWNQITNYPDLMPLAHTSQRLKAMVYSIIFKTWSCHPKDYSLGYLDYLIEYCKRRLTAQEFRARDRWGDDYYMPSDYLPRNPNRGEDAASFPSEWHSSLMNPPCGPQFFIVAGYKDIPTDALQHVQHLILAFNAQTVPHSKRLAKCLPKMKSLKEVTLNLNSPYCERRTFVGFTKGFASVIHQIRTHDNPLIVHTFLKLKFPFERVLHKYLARFQKSWRQWKKLKPSSLKWAKVCTAFPKSFAKCWVSLCI